LIIFGVTLIIQFIDKIVEPTNQLIHFIGWIGIISMSIIIFSYIIQYFDSEKIITFEKETLEIDEHSIILNYNTKINLEDIDQLQVLINGYFDQRINMMHRMPKEQKSLGVKNKIKFSTSSESFDYYFKLENRFHLKRLEEILFELITSGKLHRLNAKKSIKLIPERFKESNKYKSFVITQITEKRIGCKEGLLLHGYKSDREATKLREKYCG